KPGRYAYAGPTGATASSDSAGASQWTGRTGSRRELLSMGFEECADGYCVADRGNDPGDHYPLLVSFRKGASLEKIASRRNYRCAGSGRFSYVSQCRQMKENVAFANGNFVPEERAV